MNIFHWCYTVSYAGCSCISENIAGNVWSYRGVVVDQLGVSSRTVTDWEHGRHAPGSDKLPGLITLLQGDPNYVQALMLDTAVTTETG